MADEVVFKNEHGSVTNHDDGTATVDTKYGSATLHADGSATVKAGGVRVETDSEGGDPPVTVEKITKVAIDNVIDLESYTMKHGEGVVSYHIVYRGGGEVRLTYRSTGKVLEFRITGLTMGISPEGVVTIQKAPDAAAAA